MRIVRLIPLLCGLLCPVSLWAAPPVLAKLEYRGGLLPSRANVALVSGMQSSPYAGKPRTAWTLRAGDSLRSPAAPVERTIRFYRVNGNEVETISTVLVKYVMDGGAWRPVFHMLPEIKLASDGKRVVPVGTQDSARGMMQLHSMQQPDREGFYRELVFGFANEQTVIDGWEVQ